MRTRYLFYITTVFLAACASVPSVPTGIDQLPLVTFGDPVPADSDYVLYFPANKPISSEVTIKGNIFTKSAKQNLTVSLKKDIYSYKEWISYDGKHWLDASKTLKTKIQIKLPGYEYPKPGFISIEMNDQQTN